MATSLHEAFTRLQSDKDLARKFSENPTQTLQTLGVDISSVNIRQTDAKNTAAVHPDAVCFSIGEFVCFSVG